MAQLMVAATSQPLRRGSVDPEDFGYDGLDSPASVGGSRGYKLRRRPGQPTDVYSWFEITLVDIDVPTQTFRTSIEIHLFWQDYNLPNVIPNYEDEEWSIHDDYVPVKMTEIFENKTEIGNTDPAFKYYPKTGHKITSLY